MSRHVHSTEEPAQDSFLDVVANLVGVIIILVMLVGTKTAHDMIGGKGIAASVPPTAAPGKDLDSLRSQVTQARLDARHGNKEIEELIQRISNITSETNSFEQRRVELAMHRKIVEEDMARRERQLSEAQKAEFATQRRIVAAKIRLEELTKEKLAQLASVSEEVELECVPTPIAREIQEEAIHLRIRDGRVSLMPVDKLMNEMERHMEEIARRFGQRDELTETFGPIDSYRLRLTLKRLRMGASTGPHAGQQRREVVVPCFEILPTNPELGEAVETAFTPGTNLYRFLEAHRRNTPSVVVWLYTDSFSESNTIKRALWDMGYSIATRPMEPHQTIGFSPFGTKAAAQ